MNIKDTINNISCDINKITDVLCPVNNVCDEIENCLEGDAEREENLGQFSRDDEYDPAAYNLLDNAKDKLDDLCNLIGSLEEILGEF